MKGTLVTLIVGILGILSGSLLGLVGGKLTAWQTTLTRLSPDETLQAFLVERKFASFDRNFRVEIENLVRHETTVLLHSPDAGRPTGSERLIWSKDGKWLLLVGRHFFVKADLFLDNGDQLFFLHHFPTKTTWMNSNDSPEWPALKAETIGDIEFTEPIRLKPR